MKDENDKLRDGELPDDPFKDAKPMPDPNAKPDLLADIWKPVGEIITQTPAARKWLFKADTNDSSEGFFPMGKVGMLAAAGGVGKTMMLCQAALAVATGKPWLGRFAVSSPGRVLLALGEEDSEEVHRRLFNAAKTMGLSASELKTAGERIVALPLAGTPVALTQADPKTGPQESDFLTSLQEHLKDKDGEWSLLILDPLSRFAGADAEKDNAAATRFVQAVETLVRAPGNPAVLVAHHTSQVARKDTETSATAARGVTSLVDGFRWVVVANRDNVPEYLNLTHAKSNYSKQLSNVLLQRKDFGAIMAVENGTEDVEYQEKSDALTAKPNGARKPSKSTTPNDDESGWNPTDDEI